VYRVRRGKQFSLQITFHAVDCAVYCGVDSSLDLLHFIWTNYYDRFSIVKYAICVAFLQPYTQPTTITALYLQHYRAQSEGVRDALGCILCTRTARRLLRPIAGCSRPHSQCFCTVCTSNPPSLFNLASNTLFTLVVHIDRFELTAETTYYPYVCAVRSGRVKAFRLVPFSYPNVGIMYKSDHLSLTRIHHNCYMEGEGQSSALWHGAMVRRYTSKRALIRNLVRLRRTFWCAICTKGLFTKRQCGLHPPVPAPAPVQPNEPILHGIV
jgi:hypothetical protein